MKTYNLMQQSLIDAGCKLLKKHSSVATDEVALAHFTKDGHSVWVRKNPGPCPNGVDTYLLAFNLDCPEKVRDELYAATSPSPKSSSQLS